MSATSGHSTGTAASNQFPVSSCQSLLETGDWTLKTSMRWQKVARLAIAVFVLVFAGVVFVTLHRSPKPRTRAETPRIDQKTVAELGPLTHTITDDNGRVKYTIKAQRAMMYPDGRQVLDQGGLILPDRD